MTTIKQLAEHIGVHPRTMHKMSAHTRAQWQALASEPTVKFDVAMFDLLNQLAFNIAAFNARRWVTDKTQASLSISCTITFGVYDADITALVPARTLRSASDVAAAIKELENLK